MNLRLLETHIGHRSNIYDVKYLGEGVFLTAGGDGWIVAWNMKETDGKLVANAERQVFCICPIPCSDLILAGCMDGVLLWLDINTHQLVKALQLSNTSIYALEWSDENIIVGDGAGYIYRVDPLRMDISFSNQVSTKAIRCIINSNDNRHLYIGSSNNNIYQLDRSSLIEKNVVPQAHQSSVFTLVENNGKLWSGGRDAQIKVWDVDTLTEMTSFEAHWFTVNHMTVDRKNDLIISGSRDKRIRVWDATSHQIIVSSPVGTRGHVNSVNRLCFNEDYSQLISVSDDRTVRRWKID